jgi:ABC-type lipoprotein release transport system permease subunit
MINNVIELSGHIQVQDTNYIDNKTINDVFAMNDSTLKKIEESPNITEIVPRVESFALASYKDKTKGVAVMGIDPEKDAQISNLDKKIARYKLNIDSIDYKPEIYEKLKLLNKKSYVSDEILKERLESNLGKKLYTEELANKILVKSKINSKYLEPGDNGVVIGESLGDYLKIGLGDTLVMISQGYHGSSAANLFVVRGFIKLPLVQLERGVVFIDINAAQDFYSIDNQMTSLLLKIDNNRKLDATNLIVNQKLPDNLQAQTWEELQPETVQMIESDKAGGVFMKGIFYMIVGFIIFGTIMMMLSERRKEFGILIAVGLKRGKLAIILLYETLLISMIGCVIGFFVSFPIVGFLHKNPISLQGQMAEMMEEYGFEPILFFSNSGDIFYTQAIVIFFVTITIFLFPLMSLGKLNIIKAIRE